MNPSGLSWLNNLPPSESITELLKCCGSSKWAQQMEQLRPFFDLADLSNKAAATWWDLDREAWLEAFRSHPKIGEQKAKAQVSSLAQTWSGQEQSGVANSTATVLEELASLNLAYEQKFGYIFIVCATGKTSDEMLGLLKARIGNDPESELPIAATEQAKITELRLMKLVEGR